ncbi:MAG: zinc-binding dehydrogenase, partial [Armatimonadota bacterium]
VLPGHEIAARVEAVGDEVSNVRPGDLVAVNPNMACGQCYACLRGKPHLCPEMRAIGVQLPGGFAEKLAAPARQLLVMPVNFPPEATALLEPTSCCLHGIDQAGLTPGDPTVITGGGSIGLILLQIAKHAGAAPLVLVEPIERKRQLAETLGADATIDPSSLSAETLARRVRELTDGGAQVVIEASGHPASAATVLDLVRSGGTVLFFGVQAPQFELDIKPFDIYHRELTITGAYTNPLTDSRARSLLVTGRVQVLPLITHRYALDNIASALEAVRRGETVKAVVIP